MTSIFSDSKLIDYIIFIDMEGISLKMDKRREKMYRYIEETTYNSPKYKYKVINYFPKSPDDEASMFDHYFQVNEY